MGPIRVGMFDDSRKVRDAMRMIISGTPGYVWAGGFGDCTNLIDDYTRSQADVVLMDIQMPGISGIEAVRTLHAHFPFCRILMLTNFDDDERVFEAICAGASGYLLKNTAPLRIIDSIRELYEGGAPMTPSVAFKVLHMFRAYDDRKEGSPEQSYKLTRREHEVLEALVEGKGLKMIGDTLNISYDTVRSHIKHIYEKLHVYSLTEAVAKAIRERLVK